MHHTLELLSYHGEHRYLEATALPAATVRWGCPCRWDWYHNSTSTLHLSCFWWPHDRRRSYPWCNKARNSSLKAIHIWSQVCLLCICVRELVSLMALLILIEQFCSQQTLPPFNGPSRGRLWGILWFQNQIKVGEKGEVATIKSLPASSHISQRGVATVWW